MAHRTEHQLDNEALNAVLEAVQENFVKLAAAHGLEPATIEKWRWDYPTITLTWTDSEGLNRNINVLINEPAHYVGSPAGPYSLLIEVNAWFDTDVDDGVRRIRYWYHAIIEDALELHKFRTSAYTPAGNFWAFERAYDRVSALTRADLNRKTILGSADEAS